MRLEGKDYVVQRRRRHALPVQRLTIRVTSRCVARVQASSCDFPDPRHDRRRRAAGGPAGEPPLANLPQLRGDRRRPERRRAASTGSSTRTAPGSPSHTSVMRAGCREAAMPACASQPAASWASRTTIAGTTPDCLTACSVFSPHIPTWTASADAHCSARPSIRPRGSRAAPSGLRRPEFGRRASPARFSCGGRSLRASARSTRRWAGRGHAVERRGGIGLPASRGQGACIRRRPPP